MLAFVVLEVPRDRARQPDHQRGPHLSRRQRPVRNQAAVAKDVFCDDCQPAFKVLSAIWSHPVERDRIPSSFSPSPEILAGAYQLQEVTSGGTEESGDRHP